MSLEASVSATQNEAESSFQTDPGFGFKVYVHPQNSSAHIFSEIHVTAVRELSGVQVECTGANGHFTSTVQIASIGESVDAYTYSAVTLYLPYINY